MSFKSSLLADVVSTRILVCQICHCCDSISAVSYQDNKPCATPKEFDRDSTVFVLLFFFDSLRPSQHFFSYDGISLHGLNQYKANFNVFCSRTHRSDASVAKTRNLSASSQSLYHWAIALKIFFHFTLSFTLSCIYWTKKLHMIIMFFFQYVKIYT